MWHKVIYGVFCLLWMIQVDGFAQSINERDKADSQYIEDFPEIASARFSVARRNFNFNLISKVGLKKKIIYEPNVQGVYGFGIYYRKLGLELALGLPTTNQQNALFGRTKFWDFQFNAYGKRFGYDLNFQWYKGFHQANPDDFDAGWSVDQGYPQRQDLRAVSMGLNTYYVFNNNQFSFQAAFNQTERQVRSAGSFLVLASLFFINLHSDSTLYPIVQPYTDKQGIALSEGNFNIFSCAPGYAYTFVIGNDFYLSPSLFWGLALRQQTYHLDEEKHWGFGIGQKINFRVAGGYYGQKFFAGMALVMDKNLMSIENLALRTNTFNARLFVGYRFNRIFGRDVQNQMLDQLSRQ